jgi:hypothetical protein
LSGNVFKTTTDSSAASLFGFVSTTFPRQAGHVLLFCNHRAAHEPGKHSYVSCARKLASCQDSLPQKV